MPEIPSPPQSPTSLSVQGSRGPALPRPDPARGARGTSLRTGPTAAEPQPGRQPPQRRPDKTRIPHRSPTPFPAEAPLLLRPPLTRRSGLMPGRGAGGAAATYQPRPWSGPTHGRPRRGRPRSQRRTAGRRGRSPDAIPPQTPRRSPVFPPSRWTSRAATAYHPRHAPVRSDRRHSPLAQRLRGREPPARRPGHPPRTHHKHWEPPFGTLPSARRTRQQQHCQQPQQDGLRPTPPGTRRRRHPAA